MSVAFGRVVCVIGAVAALLSARTGAKAGGSTPGGAVISSTVTASYADRLGHSYAVQSNTVTETIASVAALAVTPNTSASNPATDTVQAGQALTRTFMLTNVGNVTDAYTIATIDAGPGKLSGIAFTGAAGSIPVTLASTVSPVVAPGGSIGVTVTISTAGIAVGTIFAVVLTARTTGASVVNGLQSASGKQWVIIQSAPSLAGPGGATSPIVALVNQSESGAIAPGGTVTYQIGFKNYGGSPADNAILTDTLPDGFTADTSTVTVNGRASSSSATLTGGTLTILLGNIPSNATVTIAFSALVSTALSPGTSYVDVAQISADTIAPIATTPASVFIGTSNILFDGDAGAAAPIQGAIVTLIDPLTNQPVQVVTAGPPRRPPSSTAVVPPAPSGPSTNPYVTAADGFYSFTLAPGQAGRARGGATYVLTVSAAGYLHRRISVTLQPEMSGQLDTATMTAADAQPLAAVGGFKIVDGSVALDNVAGLLGNIPLFRSAPVTIGNSVDRGVAAAGDRLMYTIALSPGRGDTLGLTTVRAALPRGIAYGTRTARVGGVLQEPVRKGNSLEWTFVSLGSPVTIVYATVVLPGVEQNATLTNVATVNALSHDGRRVAADALADTQVIGGVLSDRGVITGRAFIDEAGSGRYEARDAGLPDVRVFLESGESVTTDLFGRFSFPGVAPGQHVLRLDTTTLPPTVRASNERRYDSPHSVVRLVHGLMDAGLLQDIDFALEGTP